ncbi:MAG: hypothetical protein FJY10_11015 [Bacteroidetes bacterium]|nr:hypothetical protein [Bacteroidota bacterium]
MPFQFSFLSHPVFGAVERLFKTIHGLERVYCTLFDHRDRRVKVMHVIKINEDIDSEELMLADYLHDVEQERNEGEGYKWIQKDEVPFSKTDRFPVEQTVRYDLFTELYKSVLKLSVVNPYDKKSDLIFLHFHGKSTLLGLSGGNKELTLENKAIIGQLILGFLKDQINNAYHDQQTLNDYKEDIRNTTRMLIEGKRSLELIRQDHETSLEMLCRSILENFSAKEKKNFLFSEAAIAFCRKYQGDLERLSPIILRAAHLAEVVDHTDRQGHMIIQEDFLKAAMIPADDTVREVRLVREDGEQKVIDLLDTYEKAAEIVKAKGLPFNSAEVANHCYGGITASAITDALKRHHKRIIELLKKYPERWPIIRSEFRPMLNMIRKYSNAAGVASA